MVKRSLILALLTSLAWSAAPTSAKLSPAEQKIEWAEKVIEKDPGRFQAYNELALALARRLGAKADRSGLGGGRPRREAALSRRRDSSKAQAFSESSTVLEAIARSESNVRMRRACSPSAQENPGAHRAGPRVTLARFTLETIARARLRLKRLHMDALSGRTQSSFGFPAMKRLDPVQFVAQHGVVLASARGPVPSVAEAVAGEPIRGSWWGHEKGSEIFHALGMLDDSPDVLCFKLIDGKNTYVHRRLWPALVRLADVLGKERLTAIKQEHTASGAHRNVSTAFAKWVAAEVKEQASRLSESEARAALGPWTNAMASRLPRRGTSR